MEGFDAFGASGDLRAVGKLGRLQVGLLLALGGGVELGGAQAHPAPRHHSFFFAQLANFGHEFLIFNANATIILHFAAIGKRRGL